MYSIIVLASNINKGCKCAALLQLLTVAAQQKSRGLCTVMRLAFLLSDLSQNTREFGLTDELAALAVHRHLLLGTGH